MLDRLAAQWVLGSAAAGVLLLALTPLIVALWPPWLGVTFLLLPLSMLHQWEEHDEDRFRLYVNAVCGREVLSRRDVLLINIPGVWGVIAAALYGAAYVRPGLGLIAADLVLVNAATHIGVYALRREANPGLNTAAFLFVPAGATASVLLTMAGATGADHALGLGVALALHGAILARMRLRRPAGAAWSE